MSGTSLLGRPTNHPAQRTTNSAGGGGHLISNRRRRNFEAPSAHPPSCAHQPSRLRLAWTALPDKGATHPVTGEQSDGRHRSKRRERSPVASSRAQCNKPGRGHHGAPANALQATCERVPARWLRVLFIFMAKPHSSTQQAASATARFYKEDLGYPVSSASERRPNDLTPP